MGLFLGASLISIVQLFAMVAHSCFGGKTKTAPDENADQKAPDGDILYGYGEDVNAPPKVAMSMP